MQTADIKPIAQKQARREIFLIIDFSESRLSGKPITILLWAINFSLAACEIFQNQNHLLRYRSQRPLKVTKMGVRSGKLNFGILPLFLWSIKPYFPDLTPFSRDCRSPECRHDLRPDIEISRADRQLAVLAAALSQGRLHAFSCLQSCKYIWPWLRLCREP